jgi:hypothetical protein
LEELRKEGGAADNVDDILQLPSGKNNENRMAYAVLLASLRSATKDKSVSQLGEPFKVHKPFEDLAPDLALKEELYAYYFMRHLLEECTWDKNKERWILDLHEMRRTTWGRAWLNAVLATTPGGLAPVSIFIAFYPGSFLGSMWAHRDYCSLMEFYYRWVWKCDLTGAPVSTFYITNKPSGGDKLVLSGPSMSAIVADLRTFASTFHGVDTGPNGQISIILSAQNVHGMPASEAEKEDMNRRINGANSALGKQLVGGSDAGRDWLKRSVAAGKPLNMPTEPVERREGVDAKPCIFWTPQACSNGGKATAAMRRDAAAANAGTPAAAAGHGKGAVVTAAGRKRKRASSPDEPLSEEKMAEKKKVRADEDKAYRATPAGVLAAAAKNAKQVARRATPAGVLAAVAANAKEVARRATPEGKVAAVAANAKQVARRATDAGKVAAAAANAKAREKRQAKRAKDSGAGAGSGAGTSDNDPGEDDEEDE